MKKNIYESFHKKTFVQRKLISEKNFTYKPVVNLINKHLSNKSGKDILDIGCGAGTLSFYYASKGYKVYGIDISKKAIDACKQSVEFLKQKNVTFKKMNFPIEVPSKKFDYIICSEVIEHIENDELGIKKMFLLLRPHGLLFLTTPSINAPLTSLGYTNNFDKEVGHVRRYSKEDLTKLLEKYEFNIKEIYITEGIFRNFLFINPIAGKSVRLIKFYLVDVVTFLDKISLKLLGGSNIYVVAQKSK